MMISSLLKPIPLITILFVVLVLTQGFPFSPNELRYKIHMDALNCYGKDLLLPALNVLVAFTPTSNKYKPFSYI